MHNNFIFYISLVVVILFLVMLAQKIKISYPIVLVIAGLIIGFIPGLPDVEIDPELIFLIFLPPLLYEAAWQTSWKEFWKWRRVIGSFAFGIVILTSCVIAYVSVSVIPGFTLPLGFLLGAIISPPDAVSATSILKDIQVPKRIISIIEGESLLNDASSLIVYRFAITAVLSGSFVFHQAAISFFVVIIMGILTGIGVALVFYVVHRWLPTTPSIDTVLTFVAPYIMYMAAEGLGFSGVLAVVSGGLFLANRSNSILSHLSRIQGANVWATIGFVLNGIIFIMIGLELPVIVKQLGNTSLFDAIKYGLIISFVLIVARLLFTLGASLFTMFMSNFIQTADSRPGWRGPLVFGWAGMRGVVSLASALSIPLLMNNGAAFPQRNLILFITFVVILITLVFQGLTLPWVIRKMNVQEIDYTMSEHDQFIKVREKLAKASLAFLDNRYPSETAHNEILQGLKRRYEGDIEFLGHSRNQEQSGDPDQTIHQYAEIIREVLEHQRSLLHDINKKAEVNDDVIKRHSALLDLEEEKVRQQYGLV